MTIALGASKRADAHLVVRDRRGRVVADRRLVLDRTIVRLVLPVRGPGTYAVALDATAVNGRAAQRAVTFVATPPPPKPKPKHKAAPKHEDRGAEGAKPAKKSAADQGSAKRTKPGS